MAPQHIKNTIALGFVLFAIWLIWSGHYTPLLLTLGLASCLFVLVMSRRMHIVDDEGVPLQIGLRGHFYALWLIKQITLANIDVAWRILHPRLPIRPMMVRVKATQRGDLGRVIYANSITLTPGTVSVDVQGDEIQIHALTPESAAEDKSGEMNRRVARLEGSR